jgi:hypothetical protein
MTHYLPPSPFGSTTLNMTTALAASLLSLSIFAACYGNNKLDMAQYSIHTAEIQYPIYNKTEYHFIFFNVIDIIAQSSSACQWFLASFWGPDWS